MQLLWLATAATAYYALEGWQDETPSVHNLPLVSNLVATHLQATPTERHLRHLNSRAQGSSNPRCAEHCHRADLGDGVCDKPCNVASCDWDLNDCAHNATECYKFADGRDYRGHVSVTESGVACNDWSSDSRYEVHHYANSGLGGHNSCRNPATAQPNRTTRGYSERPWCLTNSSTVGWGYCDVGAPSQEDCGNQAFLPRCPNGMEAVNLTNPDNRPRRAPLILSNGQMAYLAIDVPESVQAIQVNAFPWGRNPADPDLYLSWDDPCPTTNLYDYASRDFGIESFKISRRHYGFCGSRGQQAACTLHLLIHAYNGGEMFLEMFNTTDDFMSCADGCDFRDIGDGHCNVACNVTNCGYDRGDCESDSDIHCRASACRRKWINDGRCDPACYTLGCDWDGDDCGGPACSDGCDAKYINDGECDADCNVPSCDYDGSDCFHNAGECYVQVNGTDYRGTVAYSKEGNLCQYWSDQTPNPHTITAEKYPNAGLGGHNYCRNPDNSELHPWCYLADPTKGRFELCEVGDPQAICSPPPPPVPSPPPPPPPPAPPAKPPPTPCPLSCSAKSDGQCNLECNTSSCLWDQVSPPPSRARTQLRRLGAAYLFLSSCVPWPRLASRRAIHAHAPFKPGRLLPTRGRKERTRARCAPRATSAQRIDRPLPNRSQGDCANVVAMLSEIDGADNDFYSSVVSLVAAGLAGDAKADLILIGIVLGVFGTLAACITCVWCRRRQRDKDRRPQGRMYNFNSAIETTTLELPELSKDAL